MALQRYFHIFSSWRSSANPSRQQRVFSTTTNSERSDSVPTNNGSEPAPTKNGDGDEMLLTENGSEPSSTLKKTRMRPLTFMLVWLLTILFLGVIGINMGPHWDPKPINQRVISQTKNTKIGSCLGSGCTPTQTYETEREMREVRLRDGVTVPVEVTKPLSGEGKRPGMLFIHGTGTDKPSAFRREANLIASTGIITYVPQKRIDNYSTLHRDYLALARDVNDVFNQMIVASDIDADKSGIYSVSEGCFVSPIVAATNPAIKYVAFISAPVLPIRSQGSYAAQTYMQSIHAPERFSNNLKKILGQNFGAGNLEYFDFNPSPYQQEIHVPVMMLYGTGDKSMPVEQGPVAMREDLRKAGNENLTIRYYEGHDHGLQDKKKKISGQAMQDVSDWVNTLPESSHAEPRIAGDQPDQGFAVPPIVAESLMPIPYLLMLYATVPVLLVLALVMSIVACLRRKGRTVSDILRMLSPSMASGAVLLATLLAYVWYIKQVAYTALNYLQNDLIIRGGFIAVTLLACCAVGAGIRALWKSREMWADISLPVKMAMILNFAWQIGALAILTYLNVFPTLMR
ncbi:alpha/beta hydrolase family protein [Actinotignum urinale]|uniref:Acyl-CoA thioester hydrolase/BAAT C-terminal domain-containing protein n=1 Tax=Actinotignum urinale TaxID=190146 RepID=A0ABU5G8D0_9ACTO|nr:prolyl oligopeptidase family serine peptidase [Actinotignum urinale]MDY5133359.1 acyl-CoA thioester hydrolase/BAAT C-terminal domain-containing protein [Actinotignum urinale]